MRFEVVGRSKLDGTGKLYLLLHLRLAGLMADTAACIVAASSV
jgi:hypothetical protein